MLIAEEIDTLEKVLMNGNQKDSTLDLYLQWELYT